MSHRRSNWLALRRVCALTVLLAGSLLAEQSSGGPDPTAVTTLISGLSYQRIQTLPQVAPELPVGATVIDLRGARSAGAEALQIVEDWVKASTQPPLRLVLIDSTTSADIVQILDGRQRYLITLGAASPAINPDVPVSTPLSEDEKARDAIDAGKAPQELLPSKLEKKRYDEAAMVRDHANGVPLPESPPDLLDPESDEAAAPTAHAGSAENTSAAAASHPQDMVLQRAIHLFQALVAMKQIPGT
ncbi:MAG: hypothetical protein HS122_18020 [Opitutaceae bacterium]|nr:hypothetical protein [Opitutaceae bacterium]